MRFSALAGSRGAGRRIAVLAAGLLAAGVVACGDSSSPTQSEVGHYTQLTVNGQSLPATITGTAQGTVVIQSASVDLVAPTSSTAKPTYSATVTGTATATGSTARQLLADNGTYSLVGTAITFTSNTLLGAS